MKKSEQYYEAMVCVLNSELCDDAKLEILETLMRERDIKLLVEKNSEEEANA